MLDEPTAMLDPKGRKEILETIRHLNRDENITVVLITHYMDEAALSDRVIVLDHGKIFDEGKPREIFSKIDRLKEIGLDVPQATRLAYELKAAGFNIRADVLDEKECAAEILKCLEDE